MPDRPVPALLREAAARSRTAMPAHVAERLAVLLETTAVEITRCRGDDATDLVFGGEPDPVWVATRDLALAILAPDPEGTPPMSKRPDPREMPGVQWPPPKPSAPPGSMITTPCDDHLHSTDLESAQAAAYAARHGLAIGSGSAQGRLPAGSTTLTLRHCAGTLHHATWTPDRTQVTGKLGTVTLTLSLT